MWNYIIRAHFNNCNRSNRSNASTHTNNANKIKSIIIKKIARYAISHSTRLRNRSNRCPLPTPITGITLF